MVSSICRLPDVARETRVAQHVDKFNELSTACSVSLCQYGHPVQHDTVFTDESLFYAVGKAPPLYPLALTAPANETSPSIDTGVLYAPPIFDRDVLFSRDHTYHYITGATVGDHAGESLGVWGASRPRAWEQHESRSNPAPPLPPHAAAAPVSSVHPPQNDGDKPVHLLGLHVKNWVTEFTSTINEAHSILLMTARQDVC
ncbi:hypothetical protein RRG08_061950 [Elysia crispata]|uniref:Uncharacterized protein n=1 Tax=Elysia crispata TaxID=231223 RepID=A0AAE0ZIA5_9GAST|nr:hypothetical protein RRG08_061950 [Elysia crispata]